MTEKAEQIMNRMRENERRRALARLKDPQRLSNTLESMNRMDQDPPAQVAKDQEMRVLREMNELQDFENENWSRNG